MKTLLFLVLVIVAGFQSEGGKIANVDVQISSTIHFYGNLTDVLIIDGSLFFITSEIPSNVTNPFIEDGYLYFEVV